MSIIAYAFWPHIAACDLVPRIAVNLAASDFPRMKVVKKLNLSFMCVYEYDLILRSTVLLSLK